MLIYIHECNGRRALCVDNSLLETALLDSTLSRAGDPAGAGTVTHTLRLNLNSQSPTSIFGDV